MNDTKTCTRCGVDKPLDQFRNHNGSHGSASKKQSRCRRCENDASIERYAADRAGAAVRCCGMCGTELVRRPSESNARFTDRRFCSHDCHVKQLRNVPIGDPPEVEQLPPSDNWMDHANCLGVDQDVFFPGLGGSTREAKAICHNCPVRFQCLQHAIRNGEKFGVWGGLSERQRKRIRNRRELVTS